MILVEALLHQPFQVQVPQLQANSPSTILCPSLIVSKLILGLTVMIQRSHLSSQLHFAKLRQRLPSLQSPSMPMPPYFLILCSMVLLVPVYWQAAISMTITLETLLNIFLKQAWQVEVPLMEEHSRSCKPITILRASKSTSSLDVMTQKSHHSFQ